MVKKVLISTAVWGTYVDDFFEYTLPSLFSKGNFINKDTKYKFYFFFLIEKENKRRFESNTQLKQLKIEYYFIDHLINSNKYTALSYAQKIVLKKINEEDFKYLMLFYPDSIFTENYIKNCLKLIKNKKIVLSPGPLVSLESFKKYISENNKPYNVKKLLKFTINNLHPFYESLINNDNISYVKISKNKQYLIFNAYDLHISIMHRDLCIPEINFSTIDGDYLNKINLNNKFIKYAKDPNDIFIVSFETIFSNRPDNHYDQMDYKDLDILNINQNLFLKSHNLKKNNFIEGQYIMSIDQNKYKEVFNSHYQQIVKLKTLKYKTDIHFPKKISIDEHTINEFNKLKNYVLEYCKANIKKLLRFLLSKFNYLIKRFLRFLIRIYLRSPNKIKYQLKYKIAKHDKLLMFKLRIIEYAFS